MRKLQKHVHGIDAPLKGNCFYRFAACMQGKLRKRNTNSLESKKHKRKRSKNKIKDTEQLPSDLPTDDMDDIHIKNATPGQLFHMDFVFVRYSNYQLKQENSPTINSNDGYNS